MESIVLVFLHLLSLSVAQKRLFEHFIINFRSKSHITSLQNIVFINTAKSVEINLSIRSLHYSLAYSFSALLFSNHSKESKDWYMLNDSL